jgi:EAL domain-containing protein (putative c-di-GMP-specific phosphodiesterase class I)
MTHQAADRVQLANDLRFALATQALEVHFQPQIALANRRIVGVEALARWPHRERGWIPPDEFIPIAEDSNLIHPLGEFVLAQSCRQLKAWDRAGNSPLRVAVNISARQFRSAGFLRKVEGALRVAELEAERVELELTVAMLLENPDQATERLAELKALGVHIAVDQFGRYPHLTELSRLPIDCLKIDRSLVQRIDEEARAAEMVQSITGIAHALGLRAVAVGVETAEQLELVRSQGCDEAQGERFCRSLPAASLELLVASGTVPDAGGTYECHHCSDSVEPGGAT